MAKQISYSLRHTLPTYSPMPVLFYNHIPKCGGLSLTHLLRCCFPQACDVHHNIFDPKAVPMNKEFYHGHGVSGIEYFLPKDTAYYYITILRHPWTLAQSLIRFFSWLLPLDASYKQNPETLLLQQEPNILIHYLGQGCKDKAEENLFENYACFGLQEYFPSSIALLSEIIPPLAHAPIVNKNVSTKEKWCIPATVKEAFYERNALDLALYEKAEKEFFKRVQGFESKNTSSTHSTTPQAAPEATPSLQASNTQGNNIQTVLALKETIACNEDLPGMDDSQARFENWLFILLHSMQSKQEYEQFFHWLMQRVSTRNSCLYFAFHCAYKGHLPQLATVGRHLFTLCQAKDPHNVCRLLIQCRYEIMDIWHKQGLYNKDDAFSQKLCAWQLLFEKSFSKNTYKKV